MRLIDADKIVYSWQIDADGQEHDGVTLKSIIDKMPTIEPKIVRCKDCTFYRSDGCFFSTAKTEEDGFCSWAERRTDGV